MAEFRLDRREDAELPTAPTEATRPAPTMSELDRPLDLSGEMLPRIWVVSGPKLDKGRVALWEVDSQHPEGEVFVAGSDPVLVATTSLVNEKLSRGVLAEVASPIGR